MRSDREWQGMIRCDTNFGYSNNFKDANEKLHLILKLTDWNLKILQSEDICLQ